MENLKIRIATDSDVKRLEAFVDDQKIAKQPDYFIKQYELQAQGTRIIVLGFVDDTLCAYCVLNWEPKYGFYRSMGYPAIQDLNVHKRFRKKGIATSLIVFCETKATEKGLSHMGISVGLTPQYGAAQKLYVKLKYVPDGYGVTYDRQYVTHGEMRPVDDNLCLMMIKRL